MEGNHPLVSWRSVVAGWIVALFGYVMLLALGLGIGGVRLADRDPFAANVGVASGIWLVLGAALALFIGSYFASRLSRYISEKVGAAQGLIIAALFFGALLMQVASSLGMAGRTLSSIMGAAGSGMSDIASSQQVQDVVETALEGVKLPAAPETLLRGLASRLMRGDTASARNYLARQANMSEADAEARVEQIRAQMQTMLESSAQTVARAVATGAWSLFVIMAIGIGAAIGGGALGARANLRRPLAVMDESAELRTTMHPAHI